MEEELLPKPLTDLPLPEKDLPLPEKENPANLASKGDAFRSYKRLPLILLIPGVLMILSVLVGGAYFLGKNSTSKQSPTPIITQAPTPTPQFITCGPPDLKCSEGFTCDYCTGAIAEGQPTPKPNTGCVCIPNRNSTSTPAATADWKTFSYSSDGREFSFKYPDNWKIIPDQKTVKDSHTFGVENKSVSEKNPNINLDGIGSQSPGVVVSDAAFYNNPAGSADGINPDAQASINDWLRYEKSYLISQKNISLGSNSILSALSKIGSETRSNYLIQYPNSKLYVHVYTDSGIKRYDENNSLINYKSVAEQILSTFRFK